MPKLLLKFNAAILKEIELSKRSLIVGRGPDSDIVINNPAISTAHCKITFEGGNYYVEDLDSTNGTSVNEKRIKKCGLHHQDAIQLVKHSLLFIADEPQPEPNAARSGEETLILSPEAKARLLVDATGAAKKPAPALGRLRILKGLVGEPEYEIKGLSTYIGKSDRVQIPIKGTGLFNSAPEVAASVHRKPEGYVLIPIVSGYPLVNGQKATGPIVLKDGDLINCGGTTFQFILESA